MHFALSHDKSLAELSSRYISMADYSYCFREGSARTDRSSPRTNRECVEIYRGCRLDSEKEDCANHRSVWAVHSRHQPPMYCGEPRNVAWCYESERRTRQEGKNCFAAALFDMTSPSSFRDLRSWIS